eukprot:CAMPEP_0117584354 /NCGR_PEP_ID=MMETSP0784-20121206/67550_1 /TAXON_ID=39447 /ORGANISM="" /LENGTH=194 /DNA_ID=CAMNT_0005385195 /DNA_START=1221 /DNA_END=1806 /DNA_ORIENTATION=-
MKCWRGAAGVFLQPLFLSLWDSVVADESDATSDSQEPEIVGQEVRLDRPVGSLTQPSRAGAEAQQPRPVPPEPSVAAESQARAQQRNGGPKFCAHFFGQAIRASGSGGICSGCPAKSAARGTQPRRTRYSFRPLGEPMTISGDNSGESTRKHTQQSGRAPRLRANECAICAAEHLRLRATEWDADSSRSGKRRA